MLELVAVVSLGVLAGVIGGVFGVGGGTIFVPTLALVFGLAEVEAVGTSLLAMIPLAVVGTWQQHRKGQVSLRDAAMMGGAAVVTAVAGAQIADRLPADVLRYGLAVVIAGIAIRLVITTRRAQEAARR